MAKPVFLYAALAAMLALMPSLARAAPLVPSRDADVTYAVNGPGANATQRLRWSASLKRMRIDPPGAGLYMIVDYLAHRAVVVQPEAQAFTEMPAPAAALTGNTARQAQGSDTVAGLPCTEFATTDTEGRNTVLCVTQDGVTLRIRVEGRTLMTAQTVSYQPQDETLFSPPPAYRKATP
jgi:hypothetical protein